MVGICRHYINFSRWNNVRITSNIISCWCSFDITVELNQLLVFRWMDCLYTLGSGLVQGFLHNEADWSWTESDYSTALRVPIGFLLVIVLEAGCFKGSTVLDWCPLYQIVGGSVLNILMSRVFRLQRNVPYEDVFLLWSYKIHKFAKSLICLVLTGLC